MRKIKDKLILEWRLFLEARRFWVLTRRHNASVDTEKDIDKYRYVLLRLTHTIEKGLSLRSPRKGFGQEKVMSLLGRLDDYLTRYGEVDKGFLTYPLSTIGNYIEYTESQGVPVPEIKKVYEALLARSGVTVFTSSPSVQTVRKSDILPECGGDFESLLRSRHSVRYFSEEPLPDDVILKALDMAKRTPSACNRQAWKTYVLRGEDCHRLLTWQGGCKGFEAEIPVAVVVTCDLRAFLSYEVHQAYVDGGLYAMNLINAFHSLGVGTIPLSLAFNQRKLKGLAAFGVPENEVPIVIVGVGNLPDEFKVAASDRKDISLTNTFV